MRCSRYDAYRYTDTVDVCTVVVVVVVVHTVSQSVLSSTLEKSFIAFTIFRLDRLVGFFFCAPLVGRLCCSFGRPATRYIPCGVFLFVYLPELLCWLKIYTTHIRFNSKSYRFVSFRFVFLALLFLVKYNKSVFSVLFSLFFWFFSTTKKKQREK